MASTNDVTVYNDAWFDLSFYVSWNDGNDKSSSSGSFPRLQSRSIDLTDLNIPAGTVVTVYIDADAGKQNVACNPTVTYDPDAQGVKFKVTGTTGSVKCGCENC